MKLKELIEERDILIKELKELDEISRSGQNEQKVKDYKCKLFDLHVFQTLLILKVGYLKQMEV